MRRRGDYERRVRVSRFELRVSSACRSLETRTSKLEPSTTSGTMAVRVEIDRPALRALADELGIISGYRDQTGAEWRGKAGEGRRLVLAGKGVDAAPGGGAGGGG